MGLEKITERIIFDARAEADEIIAEARIAAEKILARAKCDAKRLAADEKKAAEQRLDALRERHSARLADIERSSILAARRAAGEKVIAEARAHIENMPNAEYADFIRAVFNAQCPDAQGEILFSARDLDRLGTDFAESLSDKLTLSHDRTPTDGFIVKSGRIEHNCTLDALFRAKNAELFDIVCRKE